MLEFGSINARNWFRTGRVAFHKTKDGLIIYEVSHNAKFDDSRKGLFASSIEIWTND